MTESPYSDVVIVGAGHGGAQTAIALRQQGFAGTIALVGDEPDPPYERPPLSKEYLSGDKPFDRILLRPPSFWEERGVELKLGRRIVTVDPNARLISDAGGDTLRYGTLVWATGGSPRRLTCDGHALAGVHAIRTRADVDALVAELPAVESAVVIGGGYIGLEGAAALVKAGKRVTVLEAQDRLLARVAGRTLSEFYAAEHRAHGVDLHLGIQVSCIEGAERVERVRLEDGSAIDCDLVIAGIGINPAVEPLLAAGAAGGNGVSVDSQCRTSLADVFAIGDCALHRNRFAGGEWIRIESVQNANDQASVVAKTLTGAVVEYDTVPWFWSNQYDVKLQTIGLSLGHDAAVLRGDPATRSFSIVYLKHGAVISLDCVNATKDYVQGRRLVSDHARLDPALLADGAVPLKNL